MTETDQRLAPRDGPWWTRPCPGSRSHIHRYHRPEPVGCRDAALRYRLARGAPRRRIVPRQLNRWWWTP